MEVEVLTAKACKENNFPMAGTPPSVKMNAKSASFSAKQFSGLTVEQGFKRQLFKHDDSLSRAVNGDIVGTPTINEPSTPQRVQFDKDIVGTPRSGVRPSSARKNLQNLSDSEKVKALEDENIRLRDALKGLKAVLTNQAQLVINSAAIVDGAKKYVCEKASSTHKLTPQRRYGTAVTVKITGSIVVGTHVEYTLEVRFGEESGHSVQKRFSEFLGLRQRVLTAAECAARPEATCSLFWGARADEVNVQTLKLLRDINLPKKRWFSNLDSKVIDQRREALQEYLDAVLKACKRAGRGATVRSVVSDWLGIHRNDEDSVWCDDRIKPLAEFDTRARQARVSEAFESILNHTPVRRALSEQLYEASPSIHKPRSATNVGIEDELQLM